MTRILVVDDSRVMQSIVQAYLTDIDAEVVIKASAEEALEAFRDDFADIVISDVQMSGMSGIELSRELKRTHGDAVRVILISGGKGTIGTDAYSIGNADAFLAKPLDGERLNRLVRSFIANEKHKSDTERADDEPHRIRVLCADDTQVGRRILEKLLGSDPEIELVGFAEDGHQAVELAQTLRPQLVVMDALMPGLDGIGATRRIMQRCPTRIVVVTDAYATRGAQAAFEATRVGALDLLPKPSWTDPDSAEAEAFLRHVKELAEVPVVRRSQRVSLLPTPVRGTTATGGRVDAIAICGSTGAPRVLSQLLTAMAPVMANVPVLVVQHVLSGFDAQLARWLRETTSVAVQLATPGIRVRPGTAYIAPNDRHMVLASREQIHLSSKPASHGHRPSGDPLFESLARCYGSTGMGIILSGMGEDGVAGLREVRRAGGLILAQAPTSCVVPSMPEAVISEGLANEILSPEALSARLVERLSD